MGLEPGMWGWTRRWEPPGAGSGGDAGGFGVLWGAAEPPGPGAEVLPVGLGCGVGVMPVRRRMRAHIGEDSPAPAPVPAPVPVPPQLPGRSVPAHLGQHLRLLRAQVPDAAAHGALRAALPGPGGRESSEHLPGTAPRPARPRPARPPAHPRGLGPCPTPARPVSARCRPGVGDGGAGGDGGRGDMGAQRGLGTIGGCGGCK